MTIQFARNNKWAETTRRWIGAEEEQPLIPKLGLQWLQHLEQVDSHSDLWWWSKTAAIRGRRSNHSKVRAETNNRQIQGHKCSSVVETPRRPGKRRLEESMKKSSHDGKHSERRLHKEPSQSCCIYGYVWEYVRERERVCSSIEWKAIDFMCSGDFSEQICWQQFPSLPSRLLTLVFSDSGCLVHVDHAEYGAPGNVHDSSHPSTMVRLLLPILLRVSTPALSRISKLTDTVAQFTRTTCSSVAKSCVTLPPYGPQHTKLPCPSLSPRVCSNSCPLSQWCYLTISSSVFNLLPSTFPSIRVISSESALHIKWPKYWSFSFSICHPNEYSGLISIG